MRHDFWEIWRGVRANSALLRGGYSVIFLLANLIFCPTPLLIIIAQSRIRKKTKLKVLNFAFGFHRFYLKKLKIIQLIFELERGRKFSGEH